MFYKRSGELASQEDSRSVGKKAGKKKCCHCPGCKCHSWLISVMGQPMWLLPSFLSQLRGSLRQLHHPLPPPDNEVCKLCFSAGPSQLSPWLLLQTDPVIPGFCSGLHISFFTTVCHNALGSCLLHYTSGPSPDISAELVIMVGKGVQSKGFLDEMVSTT